MENILKLNRLLVPLFIIVFFVVLVPKSYSVENNEIQKMISSPIILDLTEEEEKSMGKKYPKILLPPNKIEKEYSEGPFRRFEITFFLAFPFVIGYQLLLNQIISGNVRINGQIAGDISWQQWMYAGISGLIMASGVGYSDYLHVSEMREREKELIPPTSQTRSYQIGVSWNFSF